MVSSLSIRKALSTCLCVSLLATCSLFVLASPNRLAGEVVVSGRSINNATPTVLVNGEAVKSGRSIFSPSTVVTTDASGATINLGKLGSFELGPNSTLLLSFDEKGVSGELSSGKLSVLRVADKIAVRTGNGGGVDLVAGQSVSAGQAQTTTGGGGAAWWVWAAVFGGAAAIIIYSSTLQDNNFSIGENVTVVSPVR